MKTSRLALLATIVLAMALFFLFDLDRYFSLDFFKRQQAAIEAWRDARPAAAALLFFAVYVAVTGLSLPGAAVMTLAAGAIFGLGWGTLIVSFASTIGATLAFLASRFVLRDMVQARFGDRLRAINEGVAKDGGLYLFTLRLVPVFPFFVINLVMGLTPIRTWTFYWVSQLGMLAGTLVYVNAGTQLVRIDSLAGILSPGLLASFALLGVFPLIAKKIVELVKARKVYAGWQKPARFDRNLVVIGAGAAGLVSSYIAAAVKAKVTLVEKHKMGGDCLNTGCVPSKALIRSAKLLSHIRRAKEFGIREATADFDFADVMARVHAIIRTVEPHDSVERYTDLGVEVIEGRAKIVSPWEVEIARNDGGHETLTTRSIIIAAGARPFVPPIPGIDDVGYYTSDTIWNLRELPRRLLVLGGGPVGSELAQTFARFGAAVTMLVKGERIMPREDPEVSELVMGRFRAEGIELRTGHEAKRFVVDDGEKVLIAEHQGQEVRIPFDVLLVAVGRAAKLKGYGLEELGIPVGRTVAVNEYLQTNYPNIYAAGDVAGPYQFTHTAAHQAWYASVNALFAPFKKFRADYSAVPWATFVDPEVARVGLNEQDAKRRNIPFELTRFAIEDLDRAIADGEAHGFVKVLTVPGKDRILGVTIVGEHAGDLIAEYVFAMRHGLGLNKILGTIHIYPTLAEANKYAAGEWKRAHAPQKLLEWVGRFHGWRRGTGGARSDTGPSVGKIPNANASSGS
ncbi:FAD-dependent oxidoreductase [Aromatoleum anaerobium]|uniref:Pyridine nucleotide-disulfide oxidoreductase n=1 Tax=Aromatoleum anaerobium TaxID=182180 RepID=A0ABX1PGS1_9RHOO|nr:bifunctional TVP38/TMEM64 family protein/FAD-dependent oxidoreductase [Aromatoleum anaerobium]MCK0507673.1 FAD-dependent oxidoreductase [Aromatoleum anaerobium]